MRGTIVARRSLAVSVLFVLMLGLGIPATGAPTTPNTVVGKVTFAGGAPAAGAFVSVRGAIGATAIADGNGDYSIGGIESGFAMLERICEPLAAEPRVPSVHAPMDVDRSMTESQFHDIGRIDLTTGFGYGIVDLNLAFPASYSRHISCFIVSNTP